jgi:predicted amidohydrolase
MTVRVRCLQLASPTGESRRERFDRVLAALAEVRDADLVVLPELWATGYFHFDRYADDAEPLDGPAVTSLADAAAAGGFHLVAGSFVERDDAGDLRNTTVLLDPNGKRLLTYRKVHLFGYESEEARLLRPGTSLAVAPTAVGTVALATCYDLRFPELFRAVTVRGAEVVVVVSAWPAARRHHWDVLTRARAIENQTYVVACNAAGDQGGVRLGGGSVVVDPTGNVLAEGPEGEEAVLDVDLDLDALHEQRRSFPVLEHRRLAVADEVEEVPARV